MLSETFWVAFIATASAMIIKLASLCYKSKCKECSVCGGRIRILRDIDAEVREDAIELTRPPTPTTTEQKENSL